MDHLNIDDHQRAFITDFLARASGFPVPVLPVCSAQRHNTLTAATRGIRGTRGSVKCVCPLALELKQAALRRQRALRAAKSAHRSAAQASAAASAGPSVSKRAPVEHPAREMRVRIPNLQGAPCTTPAGRKLLESATTHSSVAPRAREAFVQMCLTRCAKLAECRAWVLNAEPRPGAWGKIYAGLTANDRRRLAYGHEQEG